MNGINSYDVYDVDSSFCWNYVSSFFGLLSFSLSLSNNNKRFFLEKSRCLNFCLFLWVDIFCFLRCVYKHTTIQIFLSLSFYLFPISWPHYRINMWIRSNMKTCFYLRYSINHYKYLFKWRWNFFEKKVNFYEWFRNDDKITIWVDVV